MIHLIAEAFAAEPGSYDVRTLSVGFLGSLNEFKASSVCRFGGPWSHFGIFTGVFFSDLAPIRGVFAQP